MAPSPKSTRRPSRATGGARPPFDGRDAALSLIAQQARRYPNLAILPVPTEGLDGREAAFAHRLTDTVYARWVTLRFLIESRLDKPIRQIDPVVQAALLVGLAQIAFLDRVPTHAAIGTAVEWAKRRRGPRAGGMVNAVLRRLSELLGEQEREHRERITLERDELPLADGRALVLKQPLLPEDGVERLAIACGLAPWLVRSWSESYGSAEARELALHTIVDPPIVLNVAHATAPLPEGLVSLHSTPGHVVLNEPGRLGELLESRRDVWVQDAASAEPVLLAREAGTEPALICDLCAGQGTKTRQLRVAFPNAMIVAADTDGQRLATLAGIFAGDAGVKTASIGRELHAWLERADLILLDVPCSNSGVLPRRPEARARLTQETLARLGDEQRQIFADAIPLLAPSGKVLYATCSLEADENEQMAAWAKKWHGLRVKREKRCLPSGLPGEGPERYRDGSYAVLLAR